MRWDPAPLPTRLPRINVPPPTPCNSSCRANAAAKTICGSNCPEVVVFRNPTAPNLMLIADAGRAKLVYSPQVFTDAYDRYGDDGIVALHGP